jgi:hypothetical protein
MPNPENVEKHKWQPGESGNPAGREKGSKNFKTIIKKWLEVSQTKKNEITGETEDLTQLDQIIIAQIQRAKLTGDTAAFNALGDRLEGKPSQTVNHGVGGDDDDEGTVKLTIKRKSREKSIDSSSKETNGEG